MRSPVELLTLPQTGIEEKNEKPLFCHDTFSDFRAD